MHAGDPRSFQYRFRRRLLVEAADVFRYRAVEQRHVLRQIADMPSEIFVAPLSSAAPSSRTTPGGPARCPPAPLTSEVLPDALAPSNARPMPAVSEKETLETIGRSMPGAADGEILTESSRHGRGSATGGARRCRRHLADLAQPLDALPRGDQLLPGAQRDFDRRQRATHHDRGGDHHAARRLVDHDEIGADARACPTAAHSAALSRPSRDLAYTSVARIFSCR